MMKLLAFTLVALCVLGAVVAERQTTATTTPAAPASTTPLTHQPNMETDMEADPIYQEYIKKARELYVQALTDYYHAHPARLESDLSGLTSTEYENMVPPEVLDAFHIDKAKIEAKIRENDARVMEDEEAAAADPEEAEHDEGMQTMATEDTEDDTTEMQTQQFRGRFGGFGRFGFGRFGRFGGWGFGRRFGWGFGGGLGWGYGGWGLGWGYPYYGYGGWGYPYGGWGWGGRFGFGRFGFGRRFGFI